MPKLVAHFHTHNDIRNDFKNNLAQAAQWADEVIVTDNHSTDGTDRHAVRAGALVVRSVRPVSMATLQYAGLMAVNRQCQSWDWVVNLYGDEYLSEIPDLDALNRHHRFLAARLDVHYLWNLDYKLVKLDDDWKPISEVRMYRYMSGEHFADLRKRDDHPTGHISHTLPMYVQDAERNEQIIYGDIDVFSQKYALDRTRQHKRHQNMAPVKYKDAAYSYHLLVPYNRAV